MYLKMWSLELSSVVAAVDCCRAPLSYEIATYSNFATTGSAVEERLNRLRRVERGKCHISIFLWRLKLLWSG